MKLFIHPLALLACPICMRNISGLHADAINGGILTLLFIIVSLLVGFAAFFIYLRHRANGFAKERVKGAI